MGSTTSEMEKYFGTWKFISCDNFDEYLKALGIPAPLRMLAGITSPTVIIKQESDDMYSVTTDATVRSVTVTFHLGEHVEEKTVDLRTVDSVFTVDQDNDCLVWTSTDKTGVTTVVRRSVAGDTMRVVMEVKGVTATAMFQRK